eukprot:1151459-Pelagomonas_calceolata.AAC.1
MKPGWMQWHLHKHACGLGAPTLFTVHLQKSWTSCLMTINVDGDEETRSSRRPAYVALLFSRTTLGRAISSPTPVMSMLEADASARKSSITHHISVAAILSLPSALAGLLLLRLEEEIMIKSCSHDEMFAAIRHPPSEFNVIISTVLMLGLAFGLKFWFMLIKINMNAQWRSSRTWRIHNQKKAQQTMFRVCSSTEGDRRKKRGILEHDHQMEHELTVGFEF